MQSKTTGYVAIAAAPEAARPQGARRNGKKMPDSSNNQHIFVDVES
jgi:hypothetical protein